MPEKLKRSGVSGLIDERDEDDEDEDDEDDVADDVDWDDVALASGMSDGNLNGMSKLSSYCSVP